MPRLRQANLVGPPGFVPAGSFSLSGCAPRPARFLLCHLCFKAIQPHTEHRMFCLLRFAGVAHYAVAPISGTERLTMTAANPPRWATFTTCFWDARARIAIPCSLAAKPITV